VNQRVALSRDFQYIIPTVLPGAEMSERISRPTVLVLNRNWQAVNASTPKDAFCHLVSGSATALHIVSQEEMYPLEWDDWMRLPTDTEDDVIQTIRGPIRIPTVIILKIFAKVPIRKPKLNARTIRERDRNRCQYTGKFLRPEEGSIDHIVPRSRGGKDSWENCVWASKKINSKKGCRLPEEAGLQLLRAPFEMREMPVTAFIRNPYEVEDWKLFLPRYA
jgi:5-methylcytosine-specific restriction endonuclease McrA